ncbi:uncharacterized protein LOC133184481 [Saccostrea echinata]|uniref:uncharacterized protein LOC133184481 n=1 Tax=Saccostrea echinata TaxID=191078 RepID=UPI002A81EDD5|nr:uncharacterized protein LOC133184481 [Saccostrea echinata]
MKAVLYLARQKVPFIVVVSSGDNKSIKMYVWLLVVTFLHWCGFCKTQEVTASLNNNLLTWEEAKSNCTLLGPSVRGFLQTAKISSKEIQTKAWIGAYRGHTQWLNVRGCYTVYTAQLPFATRILLQRNDTVGKCVESCPATTIYGLSENYCFCIYSMPSFVTKCTARLCNGSKTDFCGGTLTFGNLATTDIMFYTTNTQLQSFVPGELQCIQGQQSRDGEEDELTTSYTYQTTRCDQLVASYVCHTGSFDVIYTSTVRMNWTGAVLECSKLNYRIADTYTFGGVLHPSRLILFWVGIFRREFTKIDTVIPNNPQISTLCTAVTVNEDGTMQLYNENCSARLPSWCEVQQTTTQTTKTTTSKETRIITRPLPPEGGNHIVSIYLPLGMFALVVLVVAITIFMLRKRIATEARKAWIETKNYRTQKDSLTDYTDRNQNAKATYDPVTRESPIRPDSEHKYDYAKFKQANSKKSHYTSIHIGTSSQRTDSTYDHVTRENPYPNSNLTSSVYDRSDYKQNITHSDDVTGDAEDTAYDHIDRRSRKTKETHDTYDHMEKK